MVDNRELANHKRQDPSLPHWPAAARWWHSRLKLMGPHKQKTELLLFPISATTGLHHVHPTWADTFVLWQCSLGSTFVLLDSDCLPVTLFEVEDLWTEAFLARFPAHSESGMPQAHPLRAFARFRTDPQVVCTTSCLQHSNGARGSCGEFLMCSRTGSELSPDEKALWIQSGLAVSPLMGTCLQYSLDFCLAWALIVELYRFT